VFTHSQSQYNQLLNHYENFKDGDEEKEEEEEEECEDEEMTEDDEYTDTEEEEEEDDDEDEEPEKDQLITIIMKQPKDVDSAEGRLLQKRYESSNRYRFYFYLILFHFI
jgi:hypothetical protein